MKNISGKKLIQFVLLGAIITIAGYSFVNNLYGPFPVGDKGFPLQPVWEIKLNDNIRQVLVSENNHVFVRLSYSVNSLSLETGELLWKYHTDSPIYSITSFNGILYVVGKEVLFTLDEKTGHLLWQQVNDIDSPSLAPEIRYIDDNVLIVVDYSDIYIFNSQTGKLKTPSFNVGRGITDICVYQGKLYTFNNNVVAYNLDDGNFLWEDDSTYRINKAVCENEIAYFTKNDLELTAYNLGDKSQVWSRPFTPTDPYTLDNIFIDRNYLITEGLHSFFVLEKNTGKLLHTASTPQHIASITDINNNLYAFYIYPQAIYSYDMDTWEITGILQYSLPKVAAVETEHFRKHGNQLIIWKNKRLFVYQ